MLNHSDSLAGPEVTSGLRSRSMLYVSVIYVKTYKMASARDMLDRCHVTDSQNGVMCIFGPLVYDDVFSN